MFSWLWSHPGFLVWHAIWVWRLLVVLAALCTTTRTEISPMNSTKRRWWQKMAERSPSWRGFRKIWFRRWERATSCRCRSGWRLVWTLPEAEHDVICFSGYCEARAPLYSRRLPDHPLWGVKSVHRYSSQPSRVPDSKSQVWPGDPQENCHMTGEFNCSQSGPVHNNPHFDIHVYSDGDGCVSTTQLICKQSYRIQQQKPNFSSELSRRAKTHLMWKGCNTLGLSRDAERNGVCLCVCVHFVWRKVCQRGSSCTSESVSLTGAQTCTSEHDVL